MLFNSWQFLLFFPTVTGLYFVAPHRFRWLLLLVASCIFYSAFIPKYLLILAALIVVDYVAALQIERAEARRKRHWLFASIAATCAVLFVFKYFNFFSTNLAALAHCFHLDYPAPILKWALPIGLSFHTFQSLSYVIEVYRGQQKPERHFGIYALYVMFYPQLVAGPIERPQNVLHQFHEQHHFEYQQAADGLKEMAWGLFKKVVIADRLALFVNAAYDNPAAQSPGMLVLATILFAFQVYCDFSGYSDIALGSARVMGFRLMQNFNRPYASTSPSEFWNRWHISLSTWLRDYVYTPLCIALRNGGKWGIAASLMITFLISGLWHGASWTYVAWGAIHGTALAVEVFWTKWKRKLAREVPSGALGLLGWMVTFTIVCFSYVFFRARSIDDALLILGRIWQAHGQIAELVWRPIRDAFDGTATTVLGQPIRELWIAVAAVSLLEVVQFWNRDRGIYEFFRRWPSPIRWSLYYGLVFGLIFCGIWFQQRDFIYFQF